MSGLTHRTGMLRRCALLGLLALASCIAPVGDDLTGDAPESIESYADLSPCGQACLSCVIAGCQGVEVACETAYGEGRTYVEAGGVNVSCEAAITAGCGNRHQIETIVGRCEEQCAANPAPGD